MTVYRGALAERRVPAAEGDVVQTLADRRCLLG